MSLAPTDPRHIELQHKTLTLGYCFGPGIGLTVGIAFGMIGAGLMLGLVAGQTYGILRARQLFLREQAAESVEDAAGEAS